MKVADLLESRRDQWQELDMLCARMEGSRRKKLGAAAMSRFATLYRAACADLALAESHQLPPNTVNYLHRLVGRSHNQLYRARSVDWAAVRHQLLVEVPRRLYTDATLRLAFVTFWGLFLFSWFLAAELKFPWSDTVPFPGFAEQVLKGDAERLNDMYADWIDATLNDRVEMAGFYIYNNAGIGLSVFALGLAFGIGGMFATVLNAVALGTSFGFMMRGPNSDNFFYFVTAHGPFELTAIVLSAAAGMHLGFALVRTRGFARKDSLRGAAKEAMPTMGAALVLFFLAAFIEAFVSPMNIPYEIKASVAVVTSGMMLFYFVILGQRAEFALQSDVTQTSPQPATDDFAASTPR